MFKINEIIQALGTHKDDSAIGILDSVGTNCEDDLIREMTVKALIERNSHESLRVVLINKGKGIYDLNAKVAEAAISSLLSLEDKAEAIKILDDTMNLHSDEEIRTKARDVKNLICCLN